MIVSCYITLHQHYSGISEGKTSQLTVVILVQNNARIIMTKRSWVLTVVETAA